MLTDITITRAGARF